MSPSPQEQAEIDAASEAPEVDCRECVHCRDIRPDDRATCATDGRTIIPSVLGDCDDFKPASPVSPPVSADREGDDLLVVLRNAEAAMVVGGNIAHAAHYFSSVAGFQENAEALRRAISSEEARRADRRMPCGCVRCACEDDSENCHGCDAREAPACQASRLAGGPRHVEEEARRARPAVENPQDALLRRCFAALDTAVTNHWGHTGVGLRDHEQDCAECRPLYETLAALRTSGASPAKPQTARAGCPCGECESEFRGAAPDEPRGELARAHAPAVEGQLREAGRDLFHAIDALDAMMTDGEPRTPDQRVAVYRQSLLAQESWLALDPEAQTAPPKPAVEEPRPGDSGPARVGLWDAVNAYAVACGGDTGARIRSVARMEAVARVERAVEEMAKALPGRATPAVEDPRDATIRDHLDRLSKVLDAMWQIDDVRRRDPRHLERLLTQARGEVAAALRAAGVEPTPEAAQEGKASR